MPALTRAITIGSVFESFAQPEDTMEGQSAPAAERKMLRDAYQRRGHLGLPAGLDETARCLLSRDEACIRFRRRARPVSLRMTIPNSRQPSASKAAISLWPTLLKAAGHFSWPYAKGLSKFAGSAH